MSGYLTFPYQITSSGRTATAELPAYVESLVRLVLLTDPGERVNRPEFGAGLKSLVFLGMDGAFASASETMIRGKLLQFLRDVITIETLHVEISAEQALVNLTYTIINTGEVTSQIVNQGLPGMESATGAQGSGARPVAQVDE